MSILFFTAEPPQSFPDVILDPEEIICGPKVTNWRKNGNQWKYIHTPSGGFDVNQVLNKQTHAPTPDLVVVHVETTKGCLPQKLPDKTRKVLLVGNTVKSTKNPLQSIISYALQERFDDIFVWNRQHAHFFKQFGFQNVYWMPGLIFDIPKISPAKERRNQMCFFGQTQADYLRRNRILKELQKNKIPIVGGRLPRAASLELAARSLVSLNISYNGDWNLRILESTAAGALLVTDQISEKSGFELFFKNGESVLHFEDSADLIKKIVHVSKTPNESQAIAKKGKEIYETYFSTQARCASFRAILNNESAPEPFLLGDEPRCQLPAIEESYEDSLIFRLQLYEFLMELHRIETQVSVSLTSGVHPLLLSDSSDLIRLKQTLYIDPAEYASDWEAAMHELQVTNLSPMDSNKIESAKGDVLITSISDLQEANLQTIIQLKTHSHLVISDWFTDPDTRYEEALNKLGYRSEKQRVFGLFSTTV